MRSAKITVSDVFPETTSPREAFDLLCSTITLQGYTPDPSTFGYEVEIVTNSVLYMVQPVATHMYVHARMESFDA